jgi:hypothetical protein
MKMRAYGNRFTRNLCASVLGTSFCVLMGWQPALPADFPASSEPPQDGNGWSAQQSPGLKVHIDPKTGKVLPAPAPGTPPLSLSPQEENAFSTSHQGLKEVKSAKPGGGYRLDLQGRFQSPLGATVDPNGNVQLEHLGNPSAAGHSE